MRECAPAWLSAAVQMDQTGANLSLSVVYSLDSPDDMVQGLIPYLASASVDTHSLKGLEWHTHPHRG